MKILGGRGGKGDERGDKLLKGEKGERRQGKVK